MAETDMSNDADVLAEQEITLTLAGKDYIWHEPKRREARRMLRAMLPIEELGRQKTPVALWECIDKALDFFYAFHPSMAADKDRLDNALEEDIAAQFKRLSEFIVGPFVRARKTKPQLGEETSTSKPEFSNS